MAVVFDMQIWSIGQDIEKNQSAMAALATGARVVVAFECHQWHVGLLHSCVLYRIMFESIHHGIVANCSMFPAFFTSCGQQKHLNRTINLYAWSPWLVLLAFENLCAMQRMENKIDNQSVMRMAAFSIVASFGKSSPWVIACWLHQHFHIFLLDVPKMQTNMKRTIKDCKRKTRNQMALYKIAVVLLAFEDLHGLTSMFHHFQKCKGVIWKNSNNNQPAAMAAVNIPFYLESFTIIKGHNKSLGLILPFTATWKEL